MIFGLFILLVALSISAVAAYYSIAGLTAIFASAVVPIIIMGASLELGKITATVWLHKYWHRCALQFKLYLVPAIIVLMIITSMGIFGFLSKAHMDQGVTVSDSAARVAILDEKIRTEQENIKSQKDNIQASKTALRQMNAQVDQLLGRTDDDRGANRAVQVRKQQARERKSLQDDITQAQKEIDLINKRISQLQEERAPLAAESRKIEAEVGPVKYIAALIYGDNPDANLLERAVRWVIILLVLVFDPLALVLILAAEQTLDWRREDKKANTSPYPLPPANPHKEPTQPEEPKGWHQEWVPDSEQWPNYDLDDGPLTDTQIDEINRQANVIVSTTTSRLFDDEDEFFAAGKELAQAIDSNSGKFPTKDFSADEYLDSIEDAPANNPIAEDQTSQINELTTALENTERDLANAILLIQEKETELVKLKESIVVPDLSLTESDADNLTATTLVDTRAGFGTTFPLNPKRGDVFLRVDTLPNKPYKWNGSKWIDAEKVLTDRYIHEEEYVKFLASKVKTGEYDFYDLNKLEQEEVLKHLDYKTRSDL